MPPHVPTTDADLLSDPGVESLCRTVNGVRLHVVAAGDEDDPLVVLLHGFPEFWYCWREYVVPLAGAGFRVLVPDQRGYNLSDKPEAVRSYRMSQLSGDVVELVASSGRESAHVVGHDWGAAVAWDLALRHPGVVDRLGIANVPHPTVFVETLSSDPRQLLESWYLFFFQVPGLPEWLLRRTDFEPLAAALRGAHEGAITEEDLGRYRAAWRREGALTGMINWYRALFRHREAPPREAVAAPTLVVWGERDAALLAGMAPRSVAHCRDGRLERFPGATHWVHHEFPEQVTDLLLDHLSS